MGSRRAGRWRRQAGSAAGSRSRGCRIELSTNTRGVCTIAARHDGHGMYDCGRTMVGYCEERPSCAIIKPTLVELIIEQEDDHPCLSPPSRRETIMPLPRTHTRRGTDWKKEEKPAYDGAKFNAKGFCLRHGEVKLVCLRMISFHAPTLC